MKPELANRALKIIDQLMPDLKYISIPDYGELNEVCIELRKESEKKND